MHRIYSFQKNRLIDFLLTFKNAQIYAPTKKTHDIIRFSRITKDSRLDLSKNTLFPIKEHFFAKHEIIFDFTEKKIIPQKPKITPKVFFGLRRCDLSAINHQDMAFLIGPYRDPYYAARREQTILFGYHCPTAPSPYCFCGSLDIKPIFDLMFYESAIVGSQKSDSFIVEIGSERGAEIIKKAKNYFKEIKLTSGMINKTIPNSDRLQRTDLKPLYENADWKKGVDLCLSCGACTTLCPTCYCFEFKDRVKMSNLKEGSRERQWSSCQLPEFTKVAGNHVFRQKREERFKHRIYHQLQYFKEKTGVNLCVGCGRCIEGCPTRIDFVKIINEMKR